MAQHMAEARNPSDATTFPRENSLSLSLKEPYNKITIRFESHACDTDTGKGVSTL